VHMSMSMSVPTPKEIRIILFLPVQPYYLNLMSPSIRRYTCMRFFSSGFCMYLTYKGQKIRFLSDQDFIFEIANILEISTILH
jgi:hypothetical protein